jgi:hypothetical protein
VTSWLCQGAGVQDNRSYIHGLYLGSSSLCAQVKKHLSLRSWLKRGMVNGIIGVAGVQEFVPVVYEMRGSNKF